MLTNLTKMYEIHDTMYINYMHYFPLFIGVTRDFNTPMNETPRSAPLPLYAFGNIRSNVLQIYNFSCILYTFNE